MQCIRLQQLREVAAGEPYCKLQGHSQSHVGSGCSAVVFVGPAEVEPVSLSSGFL